MGEYIKFPEYAGYDPEKLAAIVRVTSSRAAHITKERAEDGGY